MELTSQAKGRSIGIIVWLFLVIMPALAFLVATYITANVPGCRCDTGAGCHGCGLDSFVELCLFGGFIGSLLIFMFGWPIIFIVNLFARR